MPGALLLCALILSQLGAVYIPRDSIRNAALVRKYRIMITFGDVKSAEPATYRKSASESTNCQLPGSTNLSPSQPLPENSRNNLKIYQWNADSIRPKVIQLGDGLINSDIEVLAVQESKLQKACKTPFIKG